MTADIASILAAAHGHTQDLIALSVSLERGDTTPENYLATKAIVEQTLTDAVKKAISPRSEVPWAKSNNQCLAKAGDDEPLFVIRAQDFSAPDVVQCWINLNSANMAGNVDHPKIIDAVALRDAMAAWPNRKHPD